MELQWPLILFTLFICWSAGTFGMLGLLSYKKLGKEIQLPALALSVVTLIIGSIAVFLHLQHWERIFNGFGHITSGITQELIAIVVFVGIGLTYIIMWRKSEDGFVPKWVSICAIAISFILVVVMSHSYNMPARPAWNTPLLVLYYLGNACLFGATTVAALMGWKGQKDKFTSMCVWFAAIISAVLTFAYALYWQVASSGFSSVGSCYDPTQPTKALSDVGAAMNVFSGSEATLFWVGAVLIGSIVPLVLVLFAQKKDEAKIWMACMVAAFVAAVIGSVCIRVIFYTLGASVFMFY